LFVDRLPEGVTMRLYLRPVGEDRESSKILFSSSKKWLHPLFELEEFLNAHRIKGGSRDPEFKFDGGTGASRGELLLRDRVIGRAAAFLALRMNISRIETDLLSARAVSLFSEYGVTAVAAETIERIGCMTEDLLNEVADFDEAYAILSQRRKKALEKTLS